jgi:hypothetical protein
MGRAGQGPAARPGVLRRRRLTRPEQVRDRQGDQFNASSTALGLRDHPEIRAGGLVGLGLALLPVAQRAQRNAEVGRSCYDTDANQGVSRRKVRRRMKAVDLNGSVASALHGVGT